MYPVLRRTNGLWVGIGLAATLSTAAPAVASAQHAVKRVAHIAQSSTGTRAPTSVASGGAGIVGTGGKVAGASGAAAGALTAPAGGSQLLGGRVLRQGMRGGDVRVLQDDLNRAWFPTGIDGDFGPATASSVRAFERASGFKADGVVTPAVFNALRAAAAKAQKASAGTAGTAHLQANGTVTPPANAPAPIRAVIAAANRIAFKPYIYGGGHASWFDAGYDCSGSVSFALHGANLIGAPEASGELESYGSRGPGRWITIYANSGHTYMIVAGLRFDTAAQSSSNRNDRWTSVPASSWEGSFVVRHPTGW